MTWSAARDAELRGTQLGVGAYILVYTRVRFWGDGVGDGAERAPYLRDAGADAAAEMYFRGDRVRV